MELEQHLLAGSGGADDGNVYEDASITKIDVNVWSFPVLAEIAGLRTRGDTGVVEGGDKGVADEVDW